MAENRTINIKINQNADEATQDFKKYNKEVGNTKKAYDAVLKSGKPYEQQLADINKIVKETPLNVRDMNKQIQAYQSIALSAGRETPVGREALKAAADLRDRYIDIQNETKRLADDQKNLEGAMQGVATGVAVYGGVQSAMALSGVESEKLRETLVKLQAAQTLMNSINQVATAFEKESALMLTLKSAKVTALTAATAAYSAVTGTTTGLLKAFRIALISTGIGALVVGIGLLIANFDKLTGLFAPIIQGLKDFGDWIGLTSFEEDKLEQQRQKNAEEQRKREKAAIEAAEKYRDEIKKNADLEQRYSNSRLEQLETQKKLAEGNATEIGNIDKQITDEKIAQLKRDKEAFIEQQKANLKIIEEGMKANAAAEARIRAGISSAGKDFYKRKEENERKFYKLQKQLRTDNFQDLVDIDNQIAAVEADATLREKAELKKRQENYKNYQKNRLDAARKIEDLQNDLLEDGIDKELEINADKFRRLREDTAKNTKLTAEEKKQLNDLYTEQQEQSEAEIREKYDQKEIDEQLKLQAEFDKIKEQNEATFRTDEENELLAVALKYDKLQSMAYGNAEALKEIEIARLNEQNEIKLKYQNEELAGQDAINKQKIENEKAVADAQNSIRDAQIANVEAGISLLKDVAGKNNKLQALAIAAENAVGIAKIIISTQAANAAAKLKYAAIPGGLALAAAEITANKISAGIGIAASVAAAAKGIAALKSSAPLESGGDVGGAAGGSETIAPEFNIVGDAGVNQLAQIQQQPVQAFVVSGEVTTSQALDRNRVQNATL